MRHSATDVINQTYLVTTDVFLNVTSEDTNNEMYTVRKL